MIEMRRLKNIVIFIQTIQRKMHSILFEFK